MRRSSHSSRASASSSEDFTLDGARAVAGDLELDVVAGLESLLNNSLLRTEPLAAGEPRFGMLETIREYAVERLEERDDSQAVRRRHAGFYMALAEEAEPALLRAQQRTWLERLDAERDNLRAALTWATEQDEADIGLRIAAPLWRYWPQRGFELEGRERLERLLALRSGSEEVRGRALAMAASLTALMGDHEAVRRYGDASLPVLRRLAADARALLPKWWLTGTLGVMASSALALGDLDRARALSDEALEVGRRSGDPMTESYGCNAAGTVLAWRGELDEAERLLQESVRLARQLGNVRSVASWTRALGGIALARRDYAQARRLLDESLALHRTLDDVKGISHALSSLALAFEKSDHDAARRLIAESVALELNSGDRPGLAFNVEVCARLAAAEGRRERAVRLYACARSALQGSEGIYPAEVGWPNPDTAVAELRSALGEEAFAEAWAQGAAMGLDEALAYALEETV